MPTTNTNTILPISVLQVPPKNTFIPTHTANSKYTLYSLGGKNNCIEVSLVQVQKVKLFTNLQIYDWRNQTQFPIVKTKYVSIETQEVDSPYIIGLTIFNEHCPHKISTLYDLSLAQTLYFLKQATLGFERLFNRFGPFEVYEQMIALNEKGLCKVWLNDNFSLNQIVKKAESEAKMIEQIQLIMEDHCQQSKASKKLFTKLKQCQHFQSMMKQIDCFVSTFKILIPGRYITTSLKQISRLSSNVQNNTLSASESSIRFSIKSSRRMINSSVKKYCQGSKSRSPMEIKRFKSVQKINNMKASDGETTYTQNRSTKCSIGFFSSKRGKSNSNMELSKKKENGVGRLWLEQSTFIMEIDENQESNRTQKKQLSYSEALFKAHEQTIKNACGRKLSAGVEHQHNSFYKYNYQLQNSKIDELAAEIELVMESSSEQEIKKSKISGEKEEQGNNEQQEQREQREQKQHTSNIMKTNGWNNFTTLINQVKDLKTSFHQGQESSCRREIKLDKLDSIGRRPIAMSILPEQYEEVF